MQTLKIKVKYLAIIASLAIILVLPATALAADCKTSATPDGKNHATPQQVQNCLQGNPIVKDLNIIVNFLSAGVGVVVAAVILVGGIQYILAGDNSSALTAARQRIINGLIALVAFLFIYGFLQWLIPGGTFG